MKKERKNEMNRKMFFRAAFTNDGKGLFIGLQRWFKLLILMISYEVS